MSGLRGKDVSLAEDGIQEKQLGEGQGFLSAMGKTIGKVPGLRKAFETGAMLGILAGGTALEGCENEDGASQAVSASQEYETKRSALTPNELLLLSAPQKVAGTALWDGNPESGNLGGKEIMIITRPLDKNYPDNNRRLFFKTGNDVKELMTQGTFAPANIMEKPDSGSEYIILSATMYKNKMYLAFGGGDGCVEADMSLNSNNELEISNFKEITGIGGSDIKVIEIDGVPYLYATSLTMKRKNLITGEVEVLIPMGSMNAIGSVPEKHGDMWIGARFLGNIQKVYYSSTAAGVATSMDEVMKANIGLQANTGDVTIRVDSSGLYLIVTKWNDGKPTGIYFLSLPPKDPDPDPNPEQGDAPDTTDTGTDKDVGVEEVDADATPDAEPEVTPDADATPDTEPEVTPDADATPDTEPEVTPDAEDDAKTDEILTPDADAEDDAKTDATPDADAEDDAKTDTAQDAQQDASVEVEPPPVQIPSDPEGFCSARPGSSASPRGPSALASLFGLAVLAIIGRKKRA